MNRVIFVLFAIALFTTGAANESFAAGTSAGTAVTNGIFFVTDTVPQTPGHQSIAFTSVNLPSDTTYKGPAVSIVRTVDTAWDLAAINTPADKNARARDTVSYAYQITNKGNASQTMDLKATLQSGLDWTPSAYRIFDDANNDGLWNPGDAEISTLTMAPEATDTVVMVVLVPNTALDDDSSSSRFFVSDRAPLVSPSTTGDLWQSGAPIATNDAYDTQTDVVVTRIAGPNLLLTKTLTLESGRARPGDTIVYAITFDNDGGDSAVNVVLYDAIPMNTTFVPNSADSADLTGSGQSFVTAYDDTYAATTFDDTGSMSAKVIRWTLVMPLGVTSGDAKSSTEFTGNNDAGRVYFKVRIN